MTNKIYENVESQLKALADFLSKEQPESLTAVQGEKVLSLIHETGSNILLPEQECQAAQELKTKITAQATLSDIRKIFILFLRYSSDELISSVLGLDAIQADSNAHKGEACKAIISCFKNQSESLSLNQMGLISLPTSLFYFLDHLKELNCTDNKLTSLPSLPEALIELNCSENYLSFQSANLPARFQLGPQKQAKATHVLQAFKMKTNDPSLQNFDEHVFSDQPDLRVNVLIWLNKLTTADEFKHEIYGPVFATKILSILQCAQDNPGYCKTLQASLLEALSNCVDRATLPVNYLEVQKRIIDSKDDSLKNLLEILKGSFALYKLEQLSRDFINSHPDEDEIEIYLGFQVKLKEALNLPIDLHVMNYFAEITFADFLYAEQEVKKALQNSQEITFYLSSDKTWTDRLKKEFRAELDEILQPVFDDLEKLSEQTTLTSDQFKKESDALQVAQAKLEKEWILKKTQVLVEGNF